MIRLLAALAAAGAATLALTTATATATAMAGQGYTLSPGSVTAAGAPGTVATAKFKVTIAAKYRNVFWVGGNSDNGRFRVECSNITKLDNGKHRATCKAKFRVPNKADAGDAFQRPIVLSWAYGPIENDAETVMFNALVYTK